jgi:hypothetical protein
MAAVYVLNKAKPLARAAAGIVAGIAGQAWRLIPNNNPHPVPGMVAPASYLSWQQLGLVPRAIATPLLNRGLMTLRNLGVHIRAGDTDELLDTNCALMRRCTVQQRAAALCNPECSTLEKLAENVVGPATEYVTDTAWRYLSAPAQSYGRTGIDLATGVGVAVATYGGLKALQYGYNRFIAKSNTDQPEAAAAAPAPAAPQHWAVVGLKDLLKTTSIAARGLMPRAAPGGA